MLQAISRPAKAPRSMSLLASQAVVAPSKLVNCQLTIPRFEGANGGQRLAVIGSVEQLGAWEPTKAVPLLPSEHNETMYTAIVQLPLGEKIEAKVRTTSDICMLVKHFAT